MGFIVAAVSVGKDKEELAKKLGATYYLDASNPKHVTEELLKMGFV